MKLPSLARLKRKRRHVLYSIQRGESADVRLVEVVRDGEA